MEKKYSEDLSNLLSTSRILSKLLGFDDQHQILKKFNDANLTYDFLEGKSNLIDLLIGYKKTKEIDLDIITESMLLMFDENIRKHLDHINKYREDKIEPRNFQYLALLFSEIFLYFKFNENDFLEILNEYVDLLNKNSIEKFDYYKKEDLNKICFWMATGSGKTIIMHINFLQYLHYNPKINKIILITPNEDMSKQHKDECDEDNINSSIIDSSNLRYSSLKNSINIFDINKIKDKSEKITKNKGKTIDYKSFGKNNLILVDEGHRGSKGDKWMKLRKGISEEGFTFEYSATYNDFLDEKNKNNTDDYKRTIIFDFSYKYFYHEGYGKDYDISYVTEKDKYTNKMREYIMLGNLLSFYEQKKYFKEYNKELEDFNIEDPLWLLVGSRVKEDNKLDGTTKSDIAKFVYFLNELTNEGLDEKIEKILTQKTGVKKKNTNKDIFTNRYNYLRELLKNRFNENYSKLIDDIFKVVFYATPNSDLILTDIKNGEGELALSYSSGKKPFGLIYVGKGSEKDLIKKISENHKNIRKESDKIGNSLFPSLKETKEEIYPLNLLIGAKKFIEGWNNFRVSSILLLNFAKGAGASAIQLFGRGIRLRGYDRSLKRSGFNNIEAPKNIKIIETLNIYGIEAHYMQKFLDDIGTDLEITSTIEKDIQVIPDKYGLKKEFGKELYYIDNPTEKEVELTNRLTICGLKKMQITLDTYNYGMSSKSKGISKEEAKEKKQTVSKQTYYNNFKDFIDWNEIYSNVLEYKRNVGSRQTTNNYYSNFYIDGIDDLKNVFENKDIAITVYGEEKEFYMDNKSIKELYEMREKIQNIYTDIIKKLIKLTHTAKIRGKTEAAYKLTKLEDKHMIDDYKLIIELKENKVLAEDLGLKNIFDKFIEKERILDLEDDELNDFVEKEQDKKEFILKFNKHLYFPLLVSHEKEKYSLSPKGLISSEESFVRKLKKYIETNEKSIKNKKVMLLRNHENKGIGFYMKTKKFYYDFILWVIDENEKQKISFIDPKGLVHGDEEKEEFNKNEIKKIEEKIKEKENKDFELLTYIITPTSKEDIASAMIREDPIGSNVYLEEDIYDLFNKLFEINQED
ncbi:MAG: DEAD/DEAH box helicase family protein [Candidatus Woesearchaeota archaeon]